MDKPTGFCSVEGTISQEMSLWKSLCTCLSRNETLRPRVQGARRRRMTGVGIDSSSSSPPSPLLFLSPPPSPPSMSSFYFYSPSTPSTEVQSSSQLSLCSACEKKTEQRCSKCKVTFFCSTQCQRLVSSIAAPRFGSSPLTRVVSQLFPTHKFLCSKSTSTFRAPPLTQTTRSRVVALRDKPYFDHACDVKGRTLLEHVKMLGYFRKDGTFEVSVCFVSLTCRPS